MKRRDYSLAIGERYSLLTVVAYVGMDHASKALVRCNCDCGGTKVTRYNNLQTGGTRSCGCTGPIKTAARNFIHGLAYHPSFQCWVDMNKRCHSPSDPSYPNYGARGIEVCGEWRHTPNQFVLDMGEKPQGMSLDRIDNGKGYFKDNCRWTTSEVQASNKRSNVLLEHKGEIMPVSQWAKKLGMHKATLRGRLASGWGVERSVTTPVSKS